MAPLAAWAPPNGAAHLPLEGPVVVMGALMLLERLLAVILLVAVVERALEKHSWLRVAVTA